jgi:hypothetical protein
MKANQTVEGRTGLGEVLALAQAPRRAVSQGANQGLVPRHDFAKSLAVARQALGDQIGIV